MWLSILLEALRNLSTQREMRWHRKCVLTQYAQALPTALKALLIWPSPSFRTSLTALPPTVDFSQVQQYTRLSWISMIFP